MKKYFYLSVLLVSASMFFASAQPAAVTSSTAITVKDINEESSTIDAQSELRHLNSLENTSPIPNNATHIEIIVNNEAAPATPSATPTIKPTSAPTYTSKPSPKATQKSKRVSSASEYTSQIVSLVNSERAKANLAPLTRNEFLTLSAQKYAETMGNQNFFSHTGKDGSTFVTRNRSAGYSSYKWLGENIAAGQKTPSEVMRGWMNSDGHRANILSPKAKEIGVGYTSNNSATYKYYWVQEFGAR